MKGFHKKFLILFVLFFVLTITGQVSAQTSGAGLYIETGSGKVFAEKKGDFYQISGNNNQKILFTEDQITDTDYGL
ncbi:MAG: hypothetical protein EBX50_21135 [Chitinophagia bacterium]|nr:hypothetical protein [Chitinophagia bacterium]